MCVGGGMSSIPDMMEVECRDACRQNSLCSWFSLDKETNICTLFESCSKISPDECPSCISGHQACSSDSLEENSLLFVIGGDLYPSHALKNSVEVFDLSQSESICPDIAQYPIKASGILTAFVENRIIGCGGHSDNGASNRCFAYVNDDNNWIEMRSMSNTGYEAASSSVIDGKWLISGGRESRRSTLIYANGDFMRGPILPVGKFGHCQLTLNDTHVFISGGMSLDTFILDFPNRKWLLMENVPSQLYLSACGLINSPTMGQEVVMATLETSYIFSLSTLEWREGEPLPERLLYPASAQFENDFVVIGGHDEASTISTTSMYRFDRNNYVWIELDQQLQEARDYASAAAAPKNYISCT